MEYTQKGGAMLLSFFVRAAGGVGPYEEKGNGEERRRGGSRPAPTMPVAVTVCHPPAPRWVSLPALAGDS